MFHTLGWEGWVMEYKICDKCPGVPDAPKSANKSGQYGVGRGKVRKTRAHASVISQKTKFSIGNVRWLGG